MRISFPNRFGLWYNSLVKNCNHKGLGIYYLLSAFIFGISGTLISVLIRIELYSSGNRIISPGKTRKGNVGSSLTGGRTQRMIRQYTVNLLWTIFLAKRLTGDPEMRLKTSKCLTSKVVLISKCLSDSNFILYYKGNERKMQACWFYRLMICGSQRITGS